MDAIDPQNPDRFEATFTLDRQIARARREMGEARWHQLNTEWDALSLPKGDNDVR